MQLSKEQRIFIVAVHTETRSYKQVKERFDEAFPERTSPSKSTISSTIQKFNSKGSVLNQNKGNSGRIRTARSERNIEYVRQIIEDEPTISCRRNHSGLTKSTFNRIVKKELNYHPYKIMTQQELSPENINRRLAFCNWFINKEEENLVISSQYD